ncbi:NAD-dependent protein deacetylase [Geoglobus ahangari]
MIPEFLELVRRCNGNIVALTGAGISADSGIPTFRGKDGLWNKYRPEELATPQAFAKNPRLVWEWYAWRMEKVFSARPNPAHLALAIMERRGLLKAVITQNVDNLHERAGSRNVIHLHGRIDEMRCLGCGRIVKVAEPPKVVPPVCECGEMMRPNVVWFGEALPERELELAMSLCEENSVLVIGTSAVVYPAAYLPHHAKRNGNMVIEINPDVTPVTDIADLSVRERAGKFFEPLLPILEEEGFP